MLEAMKRRVLLRELGDPFFKKKSSRKKPAGAPINLVIRYRNDTFSDLLQTSPGLGHCVGDEHCAYQC